MATLLKFRKEESITSYHPGFFCAAPESVNGECEPIYNEPMRMVACQFSSDRTCPVVPFPILVIRDHMGMHWVAQIWPVTGHGWNPGETLETFSIQSPDHWVEYTPAAQDYYSTRTKEQCMADPHGAESTVAHHYLMDRVFSSAKQDGVLSKIMRGV